MSANRAVARFEIKSIDEDAREFSGWASTPETDIQGDVISPMGARFSLPLPVLWAHDAARPVGWVTAATPSAAGIAVTGKIGKVEAPGRLRDELDYAWSCVKSRLARGLSIGFKVLTEKPIETGYHVTSWLWLELSIVVIAANQSASITAIRSADLRGGARGSALDSRSQQALLARMAARLDPRVAEVRRARLARAARQGERERIAMQYFSTME